MEKTWLYLVKLFVCLYRRSIKSFMNNFLWFLDIDYVLMWGEKSSLPFKYYSHYFSSVETFTKIVKVDPKNSVL